MAFISNLLLRLVVVACVFLLPCCCCRTCGRNIVALVLMISLVGYPAAVVMACIDFHKPQKSQIADAFEELSDSLFP